MVLGIFSTFTWLLYFDRKKLLFSIPVNYFLGYFIAALTEFIQLYGGFSHELYMEDNGKVIIGDIILEAVQLRKQIAKLSRDARRVNDWFFDVWQMRHIKMNDK